MSSKISRSVGIHNGPFHADEVTACALLLLFDLIDRNKIIRTRDLKKLQSCEYVCDVGGIYDPSRKLFDHHQADYQGELSSAGMILLYLKEQKIIDEGLYRYFNDSLVKGVDDHDNGRVSSGRGVCTFSHVIAGFVPIEQDAPEVLETEGFFEALDFTTLFLKRSLERYQYIQRCRKIVEATMQKGHECLIFDQNIPWLEPFFDLGGEKHPALFVVMPAGQHWKLRGVPPSYEKRMQVRMPLPLEWAGLLENDLKKVSGIEGAIFCHKGRFISVWETKKDALKALEYVLKTKGKVEAVS